MPAWSEGPARSGGGLQFLAEPSAATAWTPRAGTAQSRWGGPAGRNVVRQLGLAGGVAALGAVPTAQASTCPLGWRHRGGPDRPVLAGSSSCWPSRSAGWSPGVPGRGLTSDTAPVEGHPAGPQPGGSWPSSRTPCRSRAHRGGDRRAPKIFQGWSAGDQLPAGRLGSQPQPRTLGDSQLWPFPPGEGPRPARARWPPAWSLPGRHLGKLKDLVEGVAGDPGAQTSGIGRSPTDRPGKRTIRQMAFGVRVPGGAPPSAQVTFLPPRGY